MGLPCIKGLSGMLCACGTIGDHHTYLPTVSVATISPCIEHALSCSRRGFPSIYHNEIRNITADLLSEVCHRFGTEPSLQPVTGEQFEHRTANREDDARLDIVAQSFWGRDRQSAFFDVRVFQPLRTLLSKFHHSSVLSEE